MAKIMALISHATDDRLCLIFFIGDSDADDAPQEGVGHHRLARAGENVLDVGSGTPSGFQEEVRMLYRNRMEAGVYAG